MPRQSKSNLRPSKQTLRSNANPSRTKESKGDSSRRRIFFIAGGLLLFGLSLFASLKLFTWFVPPTENDEAKTYRTLENASANELETLLELPTIPPTKGSVIDVESWTKQVDEAIQVMRKEYPDDAQVLHLAGLIHLRLKRTKMAEPDLRRAVAIATGNSQMRMDLADLLVQLGRDAEAIETLLAQPAILHPTAEFLTMLGECQQRTGQLAEAEQTLLRACRQPPSSNVKLAHLWQVLAKVQLQTQNLEEAAKSIEQASELNADDPENWLTMSRIYRMQKKTALAQEAMVRWKTITGQPIVVKEDRAFELEHSQSMSKVFSSIFRSMATFHLSKKKEREGQASYDKALRVDPGDAQALASLANMYRMRGEIIQAVDANRQLLQMQSNEFAHYQNMANLAMELERPDAAEAVLRLACFRMPENGNCHLTLARFLLLLQKPSQAIRPAETADAILQISETDELLGRVREATR